PDGTSISLKIEDSTQKLLVRPTGIPISWLLLSAAGVLGFLVWFFIQKAFNRGLDPLDILSLVVALGAVPGVIGFFHLLNSHILSKGVYFVLDKAQRILTLPRVGRSLQQLSIVGFVEVHAWHTTKDTWGSESSWLAELSVLIREENGQISR